jgi:hypothetical protein
MTSSLRVWLTAVVCSVGVFTACGSGGGGGGGGTTPPPVVDPNLNPSLDSLLPTAPAAGATLIPDAATLRPASNGAAYVYRGTTGAAAKYSTTTSQTLSGGTITEAASNAASAGPRSAPVSVAAGANVSNSQSIDFAGKGVKQAITFIELQSPVRQDDQYKILLQRYLAADTTVDVDKDGKTDLVDVAIYARVMGKEVLSLPNLPPLNTVRVDTVSLQRVTKSSDSLAAPTTTTTVSTWYAQGIGIVRQTTSNGSQTTDEKLVSWDGVTAGLGAMAPQAGVVPGGAALPGLSNGLRAAVAFDSYGLVFSDSGAANTAVSKIDTRGKVTASTVLSGLSLGANARVVRSGSNVLVLRLLSGADSTKLGLTRLDANGALVGTVDGVKLNLAGTRSNPSLSKFEAAADDTQLWVMWTRANPAPNTAANPANELLLRSFSTSTGAIDSGEFSLDIVDAQNLSLSLGNKVAQPMWQQTAGGQVVYGLISYNSGTAQSTQKTSSVGGPTATFASVRFGDTGALLWPVSTGGTAGLQLNASGSLVGSTGSTDNNKELLGGLTTASLAVPAFSATSPLPVALSTRLAVSSQGTGDLWPGEVNPALVPGTVSWLDASATPTADNSLAKQTPATVRFAWDTPLTQLIFSDRVLLLGGANALSTTVVWMNRGP